MLKVAVIMGSKSDYDVAKEAINILELFDVSYIKEVVSAHRTPEKMYSFCKEVESEEIAVVIAIAGGSAHLPGMVASMVTVPVIGVPVMTKTLSGVDSLYSIVQMPGGVPVATVAINGGVNAGLLAVQILSIRDAVLKEKLVNYKNDFNSLIKEHNEYINN